ncbi:MAG TPA: response regulator [Candidatus Acidoferrales bacterium]|nr:response regulator [Candidatus Acidoferrales bacterium]
MPEDKIRVLLVEDNPGDARLVEEMLKEGGADDFVLKHVESLQEGMSSLSRGCASQVILLDLGLPDETGLQTLRRIMPLAKDASAVVLTGLQDEDLGIAAIREGAHDYIIKGQVDGRQLRRILRYAVERQKMQSELRAEMERRARVQEALQFSEERYRLLSETAPLGILISDELGRIVDANAHTLLLFGYKREELIGQTLEKLLPEHLQAAHQRHRSRYMNNPQARPMGLGMELLARRQDRTQFPVEISLGPLVTEQGSLVSATIVDITARKKLEEQLHIAQRMEAIGKLAGAVAHDFNNLLGVILGCSEVALDVLTPEHPAARKVEMIRKAGSSAADLTRQLLAFSRQQMLQPRVLNLTEILGRSESLLHCLIGENIKLAISPDPSLGCVKADPGQIEQILVNLAVNARDAMPRGGRLTIEARNCELDDSYKGKHEQVIPGRYVMLAVEDTGCGMDADTQSRIFDPFFTTKEIGKGTGLGLATVYGIVKQSGGYIWIYSEPNKGTTFKVYFPRVEQSAEPPKQKEPEAVALHGCETILLAEDSASLRQMAREYLENSGYTVLEASSGSEALEQAKDFQGPIHLLLTDVVMPGMSGPELAGQIASQRPETKVIFTSGYTDDAIARQGVLDPAAAFIQKPYRPKALARKIREVLGGSDQKSESPVLMRSRSSSVT